MLLCPFTLIIATILLSGVDAQLVSPPLLLAAVGVVRLSLSSGLQKTDVPLVHDFFASLITADATTTRFQAAGNAAS